MSLHSFGYFIIKNKFLNVQNTMKNIVLKTHPFIEVPKVITDHQKTTMDYSYLATFKISKNHNIQN